MSNNKKEGTGKKVIGGIALGLVLILLGGVAGGLLQHHYKWGEDEPTVEEPEDPKDEDPTGGTEIDSGEEKGVKLSVRKLMSSEYEEYGVSALAEDAYTLTATVYPADAANKAIDWSVSFTDAGDEWATGKTVTDYVTVTPTSDGALTATVENIAAFGEQITVKATSRDNSAAYATCTVEYLQRTTGYTFVLDEKTYSTTGTKTNEATPTFAGTDSASAAITVNKSEVYTRANNDKAEYFTIKPTEEFKTALTEAGITATALKEYSGSASATVSEYFDSAWGAALYGSDNAKKNALIGAIDGFDGNAYEIKVYTENGGSEVATFHITLNASTILGQKGVESVTVDDTEIIF